MSTGSSLVDYPYNICEKTETKILRPTIEKIHRATTEAKFDGKTLDNPSSVNSIERWKRVLALSPTQPVDESMKTRRCQAGNQRHVVMPIGRLRQEDAAGPENPGNLAHEAVRIGDVLEDIVGEDEIEARIAERGLFGDADMGLVEIGVVLHARIGVEADHLGDQAAEVHVRDDSRTGTQIEDREVRLQMGQDLVAKELVVPVLLHARVKATVEPSDGVHGCVIAQQPQSRPRRAKRRVI